MTFEERLKAQGKAVKSIRKAMEHLDQTGRLNILEWISDEYVGAKPAEHAKK